jgi:hypothetical protein
MSGNLKSIANVIVMNTLLIKRPTRKGGGGKGGGSVVMGNGDEKLTFHFSSYDGKISCHGEQEKYNCEKINKR